LVDIDIAGRLGLIARENELHEVYDLKIIVYMDTPFVLTFSELGLFVNHAHAA
jgi:hypothetical protein